MAPRTRQSIQSSAASTRLAKRRAANRIHQQRYRTIKKQKEQEMEMELARLREEIINYRERFNNLEGVTRAPTDSGSEVQYNQAIALENHRSVQEPQEPDRAGRGATLDNSYLELISPASIDDMFTIDQFLIDLPAEDGEQGHIFSACQRAHDSCFSIGAQSLSSIYHLPRPDIGFNQHTQAGEQNPSSQDIRSLADKLVIIRVQRVTDSISRLLDCECINASDTNLLAILAATISRIPNFYQALYDFNLGNQSFSQPTTQNESSNMGLSASALLEPSLTRPNNSAYDIPVSIEPRGLFLCLETNFKSDLLFYGLSSASTTCSRLIERVEAFKNKPGEEFLLSELNCARQRLKNLIMMIPNNRQAARGHNM